MAELFSSSTHPLFLDDKEEMDGNLKNSSTAFTTHDQVLVKLSCELHFCILLFGILLAFQRIMCSSVFILAGTMGDQPSEKMHWGFYIKILYKKKYYFVAQYFANEKCQYQVSENIFL